MDWAKSPVPFCIPTTGGQQKSLPWIKNSPWDNPYTKCGVFMRMVLEVLCFRSLFRNTSVRLQQDGPKVGYSSEKSLWLFALIFHYCFLVILVRHLRFFMSSNASARLFARALTATRWTRRPSGRPRFFPDA